ncbi:hypothetical protein [Streptomyces sp. NPDC059631]|uniref:hypothetical protein n=1 Tax=unclassified Streptomyces TaxID=2593676 RepID=UPI003692ED46
MNRLKRVLAASAASITLASGLLGAGAGSASAASEDCPVGAMCVYAEGVNGVSGKPTDIFWTRGVHKIHNKYNYHWVYNNQTDGWTASLCRGADGTGCDVPVQAGYLRWTDLTPINTIVLRP